MKILITGNMGYVGCGVINQLRSTYPDADLIGFDTGYFAHCLTNPSFLPERKLTHQIFGDVRNFNENLLTDIDSVIYLAAISNDPMGNKFEKVTMDVNYKSAVRIANLAKLKGARSFVYASSCSVYGAAGEDAKKEHDLLNPLTAYARSKVLAENGLQPLADSNFTITCLRFATACGYSKRLRLDLVLNDFIAGAVTSNRIDILSDGTPLRPLINVLDMARAIDWAVTRSEKQGGSFLIVNTGSNTWNYEVKELAEAVAGVIHECKVSINPEAPPDKRSYKVNFNLFEKLAPNHQPVYNLKSTIESLLKNLKQMNFTDRNFRESQLIRLKVLDQLINKNLLNNQLYWKG